MIFGKAQAKDHRSRQTALKRMARLPNVEIIEWCDNAGTGIARALSEYRKGGDPAHLEDARSGAEALLACVEVMQARV